MPTVLKMFGLRVVIYPNDHNPAHVHVTNDEHEAAFNLNCPSGPPRLRENYGFSRKALQQIADALATELQHLCKEWKRIHG